MVLCHQGWSDQAWQLAHERCQGWSVLIFYILPCLYLMFFLLLPLFSPRTGVVCALHTVCLVFDFASHPFCVFGRTSCPLCLSCPLSSSFLLHINPTYNDTHLSLSLWWSSRLHTWGKMVAHSVWLRHHHVTKHLNAVASYTILVLIFMTKAS